MGRYRERVMTRRQIEGLIAEGKNIVIYDGNVLSVNAWLPFHPGGDKAILHMVGHDATDEINVLHGKEAKSRMKNYIIGKIVGHWENFTPPIRGGVFRSYDPDDSSESEEEEEGVAIKTALEVNTPQRPASTRSSSSSDDQSILLDPSLKRRRRQESSSVSASSSMTDLSLIQGTVYDSEELSRKAIEEDLAKYPALDDATQNDIVRKYRELGIKIEKAGLYKCNYFAYAREVARYTTLFGISMFLLYKGWYKLSAVFLGCFWHQLVFSAHDAGHQGITHNYQIDTCLGIGIANFCGGLSLGWWKRSHNVHHIVTNDPVNDPDIQHLPFFAVSHKLFESVRSTYYDRVLPYDAFAKVMVRIQNYSYYPILCFGRFNLYRLSLEYLILGLGPRKGAAAWHRYLELSGLVFFWYWFGYGVLYNGLPTGWDRFVYVMISHIVTMPVHVQITLSHFAMSTADLGEKESFAQKMLRTTMDVDCPEWLDFFHGGLQFQAVHHLFPRVPRHNLRQAQKFVIEYCKDVGIPYSIYGFYDGNKEIIGRLRDIAQQAKILAECQKSMKEHGEYGSF